MNEEDKDIIKEYPLLELKKEKISFEEFNLVAYRYDEYEIVENYIYGIGEYSKIDKRNYNDLFKKESSLDLILDLYNLGNTIYSNINDISQYYKEVHEYQGRYYNKPSIEIDIKIIKENTRIKK